MSGPFNMGLAMQIVNIILTALLVVVVVAIFVSVPTMLLWNWLMPVIFGLSTITWLQALGLCLLCSILFKSSGKLN